MGWVSPPAAAVVLPIALLVAQTRGQPNPSAPPPSTSITNTVNSRAPGMASTTAPLASVCPALVQCMADPQCAACLGELRRLMAAPSEVGLVALDPAPALNAFASAPACSAAATPPALLTPTLWELSNFVLIGPGLAIENIARCVEASGIMLDPCVVSVYACAQELECRECLFQIYSGGPSGPAVNSSACRAANATLLFPLAYGVQRVVELRCTGFPVITYAKQQCRDDPACDFCWRRVLDGNLTALEHPPCTSPNTIQHLDTLVARATSGSPACPYFSTRCAMDPDCAGCLAAIGGENPTVDLLEAHGNSTICRRMLAKKSAAEPFSDLVTACPQFGYCLADMIGCGMNNPLCFGCFATPPTTNSSYCNLALSYAGVETACAPCPSSVNLINRLVRATAIVGWVSVGCCLLVALQLFARGADRVAMRARIILGLMLANGIYSAANIVPTGLMRTGVEDCGELVLSFETIRSARATWFLGKFSLACFEVFILAASVWVLGHGSRISLRAEATQHAACLLGGLAAFLGFYFRCLEINNSGYNEATEKGARTYNLDILNPDDDQNDILIPVTEADRFTTARAQYDQLEERMLQVWLGLLGLAVAMWLWLRWTHARLRQSWNAQAARTREAEATDEWVATRRGYWKDIKRLLALQKVAYREVVAPLEPFVLVFVLFGIPAVVMATDWCQKRSGASLASSTELIEVKSATYGTCDVWCELLLSFRSLATVLVFYSRRQQRLELYHLPTTVAMLWRRVTCRSHPHKPAPDHPDDGMALYPLGTGNGGSSDESWLIASSEIELDVKLAEGACGVVWKGKWSGHGGAAHHAGRGSVAIKLLKMQVDEDGDLVDPTLEDDFRHECKMLTALSHPHLLRFHGFGKTPEGQGFIVTELMQSSLRALLRDSARVIPWRARLSIATQLASGMAHLHALPIVHRDLKSANALVDNDLVAKVADFGTSRHFRRRAAPIVVSSFTGQAQLASDAALQGPGPDTDLSVGVMDSHGTMTKAVGTLLWMAPEALRGDRSYGPAVDVYSFGIMLWELATRETPWDELGTDIQYITLCQRLTNALKTGRRPTIPEEVQHAHPGFVAVMESCWQGDPVARPPFAKVHQLLRRCESRPKGMVEPSEKSGLASLTEPLLPSE